MCGGGGGGNFRPAIAIPPALAVRGRSKGAGASKGGEIRGRDRKRIFYPLASRPFTLGSAPTPHVDNYNYGKELNRSEISFYM